MIRSEQRQRLEAALTRFWATDLDRALGADNTRQADAAVLDLFRSVVRDVPAYRSFLLERDVDPSSIRTIEQFAQLPTTSKDDYQRRYSLPELCRHGRLSDCDMVAASTGSTGTPAIWPRFVSDEYATALRFEQIFHDAFAADRTSTLAVVCFALGTWVGGLFTIACCRHLAGKGYPVTVVAPGNNPAEIVKMVRQLGPHYQQVVLLGYPPFLKDTIDYGRSEGLDWSEFRVRLVLAGEVFSEPWRDLVCERLGARDPAESTASLYGTADAGVLGNETPLSVHIRRFVASRAEAARELFGEQRLPTLCQYDPLHRYFEAHGRELVFSGDGGVPLIRYRILDTGGVIPYEHMLEVLRDHGFDAVGALSGLARQRARELPFVFVFGRSSFAVSFYGANVYPENVAPGVQRPEFGERLTGKFVIEIRADAELDRELQISVELAPGQTPDPDLEQALQRSIAAAVRVSNSEFAAYVPAARQTPRVQLLEHAAPDYFPLGVKHRYTRD